MLVDGGLTQSAQTLSLTSGANLSLLGNSKLEAVGTVTMDWRQDFQFDDLSQMQTLGSIFLTNQNTTSSLVNLFGETQANLLYYQGSTSDDLVNIRRIDSATTIYTDRGNDVVNVGSNQPGSNSTLSLINNTLNLNGAEQIDTLTVDDRGNSNNTTGTITANTISGFGMGINGSINYSNFENLNVKLGSGANTVTVQGSPAGNTNLDTDGGDDAITINNFNGTMTVNSGSGSDQVTVNVPSTGLTFIDPEGTTPGGTGGTDPNDPFGTGSTGSPNQSFAALFGIVGLSSPQQSTNDLFGSGGVSSPSQPVIDEI